jgi:hypothetical protein
MTAASEKEVMMRSVKILMLGILVVGFGFMGNRAFCEGELPKEILNEVKNTKELPSGTYSIVRVYEAETMQHQENKGSEAVDPQASRKKCFVMDPDSNDQGCAIYGPYKVLEPGKYVVFFRIKLLQDAVDEQVAVVDVTADYGVNALESKEVMGIDLEKDKYVQIPLVFEYTEGKVETRVIWGGQVKSAIDCITIYRIK